VLEELRVVKGEEELSRFTAPSLPDHRPNGGHLIPRVRPGQTERELAWQVAEQDFTSRGAVGIGFDLIAAVGLEHGVAPSYSGRGPIGPGEPGPV
jgi:hypothetical protein